MQVDFPPPVDPEFFGTFSGQFLGLRVTTTLAAQAVAGGAGGAANSRLYGIPLPIRSRVSIDRIGAIVGTQVLGVSAKFGVAPVDLATGGWGPLLCATASTSFAGAANDEALGAITVGASELAAGAYWGLFIANGAAQPVVASLGATAAGGVVDMLGATSLAGLFRNAAGSNFNGIRSVSLVDYDAVLLAPGETLPAFARTLGTPGTPLVGVRVA
jgi:hypothetical protein